ncbi:MAG: HEAT repeat domain-containing protein [Phycisphaerae bacterium]|nr:HEAT repeat domain-containing protein [Phycisphaerae bacterium]
MRLWRKWKVHRNSKRLASGDADERYQAALELLRVPDRRAVMSLIHALTDSKEIIRMMAAKTLGLIADLRATEPLVCALGDTWDVRCRAIVALGEIRDPKAIQPLVHILRTQPGLRELVIRSLTELEWSPDTPELRAVSAVARREYKQAASEGSVSFRPMIERYAVANLILYRHDFFVSHEEHVRELGVQNEIREVFGEVGRRASDQVLDLAIDPTFWAHREAVEVLATVTVGDDAVVKPLGEMLFSGDSSQELKGTIIEALEQLRHPDALPYLLKTAMTADYPLGKAAISAMVSIGRVAVDSLWTIVESPDLNPNLRDDALDALGDIGSEASVPRLIGILSQSATGYDPHHAAKALGKMGTRQAVEPLIAALSSSVYGLPRAAAEALGEIRDGRALLPLANYARSLKSEDGTSVAVDSMIMILESCMASINEEDLAAVSAMADIGWKETDWSNHVGQWSTRERSVDCSRIRQLAAQELARRTRKTAR